VIVSPDLAGSPDGDARVIELSWDEPEHFAAIFDRYFAEIHRYLARRAGARVAADLAGEVFLAAFAQRKRYDTARANARPWLYGIATNVVGSHRRHERRFYHALARGGLAGAASPSHHALNRTARPAACTRAHPPAMPAPDSGRPLPVVPGTWFQNKHTIPPAGQRTTVGRHRFRHVGSRLPCRTAEMRSAASCRRMAGRTAAAG